MKKFTVKSGRDVIGTVSPRIYGGFVEHAGRNVYGGVYDPEDPTADKNGFRNDVLACVRDLDMPITRYPGGSFTSTWRWEDGIGPQKNRPVRLDAAWQQMEPNLFGIDEFIRWARLAGTEPMITLNLCTRGILEAEALWEYCNFPGGTAISDMRIRNGFKEPHNVRYWCLGNEIFGAWEVGQKSAQEYAVLARETAKLLKQHDPDLKLVLCGTPDDMNWNRIVLDECYPYIDIISLHEFFNNTRSRAEYLRKPDIFGERIEDTAAVCEVTRHNHRKQKEIKIAVDEWVVWNFDFKKVPGEDWTVGPHLLEQDYTMLDALLAGTLLTTLQNHCDKVDLACIAQTVNVIAPIRTEKNGVLWKQSIYDVFRLNSKYGRGEALKYQAEGDDFGADPAPAVSVIRNEEDHTMTWFITVRGDDSVDFSALWEPEGKTEILEAYTMSSKDMTRTNAPGKEPLHAKKFSGIKLTDREMKAKLAPLSWNMIRIKTQ